MLGQYWPNAFYFQYVGSHFIYCLYRYEGLRRDDFRTMMKGVQESLWTEEVRVKAT